LEDLVMNMLLCIVAASVVAAGAEGRIAERLSAFPGMAQPIPVVGAKYRLSQKVADEEPVSGAYCVAFDGFRYYSEGDDRLRRASETEGHDPDKKSWTGEGAHGLYTCQGECSGVDGNMPPSSLHLLEMMFGTEPLGGSFADRLRESPENYSILKDTEDELHVLETRIAAEGLVMANSTYVFRGMANPMLTEYSLEVIDNRKGTTEHPIRISFQDHEIVKGVALPRKIVQTAWSKHRDCDVIRTAVVEELWVNNPDNIDLLARFDYDVGSGSRDEILVNYRLVGLAACLFMLTVVLVFVRRVRVR
jgi:hypothetical protein